MISSLCIFLSFTNGNDKIKKKCLPYIGASTIVIIFQFPETLENLYSYYLKDLWLPCSSGFCILSTCNSYYMLSL